MTRLTIVALSLKMSVATVFDYMVYGVVTTPVGGAFI
jgi:hypothetical protein